MTSLQGWFPVALVSLLAIPAAVAEIRTFRVPNPLVLTLLVSAFVHHGIIDGAAGISEAGAGALLGAGLLAIPYLAGGLGAGDLKLMAGIGAWLGSASVFEVFLVSSVLAACHALLLAARPGRIRTTLHEVRQFLATGAAYGEFSIARVVQTDEARGRLVPFAAMQAAAVLLLAALR